MAASTLRASAVSSLLFTLSVCSRHAAHRFKGLRRADYTWKCHIKLRAPLVLAGTYAPKSPTITLDAIATQFMGSDRQSLDLTTT
jgi:hypothetical protein